MNLSYFISRRYFFSKKKKNFINIIAIISMLVVSIGTAALIIALSIFNGMEGLLRGIYGEFDAPIQIVAKEGKSFQLTKELKEILYEETEIVDIIEVIEDNALLKYNNSQMIVRVKGYSDNFLKHERMRSAIKEGDYQFFDGANLNAIIGRGILYKMGISLRNKLYPLQFYYPKNVKPGSLNPSSYYKRATILTGGVFALEQSYDDNYVFVPIVFAENLFDYSEKRTAVELLLKQDADVIALQTRLNENIGAQFRVLSADEQHADIYKVLKIEKLFIFITLSLIVAIASVNIFFSLSMLVTEKKSDIGILMAMGASKRLIQKIFLSEGALIAFIGAGSGLILGYTIARAQQEYGFLQMGVESAVMAAYPVKILTNDFIYSGICIIAITMLAAVQPAFRASKFSTLDMK